MTHLCISLIPFYMFYPNLGPNLGVFLQLFIKAIDWSYDELTVRKFHTVRKS